MATLSQVGPAPHSQDVPRADLLLARSSTGSLPPAPAGTHCPAGVAHGPWPVARGKGPVSSWVVVCVPDPGVVPTLEARRERVSPQTMRLRHQPPDGHADAGGQEHVALGVKGSLHAEW